MNHNNQIAPGSIHHHWNYGTSANSSSGSVTRSQWHPQQQHVPATQNTGRGTKRAISESDDGEDGYSEESSKEPCTSPNDSNSCCQMLSRKKRRGVIEKKRRDRINSSLTELKRLVPSAYEKQGSAKLEKAEILQMTVDHLKMLHAKGLDNLAYDPHKFAMDYHIIGFRECAAEVARYLVTIEGMDIQDPLRLRLMSHLQCFVTQRELASKQASTPGTTSSPWSYGPHPPPPPPTVMASVATNMPTSEHYPGAPAPPVANPVNLLHPHHGPPSTPSSVHHHVSQPNVNLHDTNLVASHYGDLSRQPPVSVTAYSTSSLTPLTSSTSSSPGTLGGYHSTSTQYHNLNSYPTPAPASTPASNYSQSNTRSSDMKPYRPWGAEVAY